MPSPDEYQEMMTPLCETNEQREERLKREARVKEFEKRLIELTSSK